MRFFLHLAYQGTKYRGWQRQGGSGQIEVMSVQERLEQSISQILREPIKIHGCGRTDAGVHSSQYFAYFDIEQAPQFHFIERLNYTLPHDIAVYDIIQVPDDANTQTDAISRTYEYYIHLDKVPGLQHISSLYHIAHLDLEKINCAVSMLSKTRDFRSLCKSPDIYKHTRCNIYEIKFEELSMPRRYKLTIAANRFLRGMIRYMVARLLEVGSGDLPLQLFEKTISTQSDFEYPHQNQAHAQGLYLSHIIYPYLELDTIPFHN